MDLLGPCTNVFLTAYAHVRTEPQSDIGQTRGKKSAGPIREAWQPIQLSYLLNGRIWPLESHRTFASDTPVKQIDRARSLHYT